MSEECFTSMALHVFKARPLNGHSKAKVISRWLKGVPGSPGKSQEEGEEDLETLRQLGGGCPLALLPLPGLLGLPSGSSLSSLELPKGVYP